MEKSEKKRKPGRPRKYGEGRIHATVRFTPERYAELKADADRLGRSVSEQVEALIEQALTVSQTLAAVSMTLPELQQRTADSLLRAQGYTWVHSPQGKVWYPPGHPVTPQQTGVNPPEEST
jgi:hypothetical protein